MSLGIVHYLAYPTSSTYACGADAVGRRSTLRDGDPLNTTCSACRRNPVASHAYYERLGRIILDAVGADKAKVKQAYGTDDLDLIGRHALRFRDVNPDGTLN